MADAAAIAVHGLTKAYGVQHPRRRRISRRRPPDRGHCLRLAFLPPRRQQRPDGSDGHLGGSRRRRLPGVCLLSLGSIALVLGLLLPRPVEALGVSIAFLIGSAILDDVPSLHTLAVVLPVHYWMRWTLLFDGGAGDSGGLVLGLAVKLPPSQSSSPSPTRSSPTRPAPEPNPPIPSRTDS